MKKKIDLINKIKNNIKDIKFFLDCNDILKDTHSLNYIHKELCIVKNDIKNLELILIFNKKIDILNCYLRIKPGSGGKESQNWANILFNMYIKWIKRKKFKYKVLKKDRTDRNKIKDVLIEIIGKYSYGFLKSESGVHRLIRKNPLNLENKRHTSFSSVFVYPKNLNNESIKVLPKDIKIDVYKSKGSGGQHVNTTESAVRIKHLPTGLVSHCQDERSQHKNRKKAMKSLINKIDLFRNKKNNLIKNKNEKNKPKIKWGNQIRSYILDDSRIIDNRTKFEYRNIKKILIEGKIDIFIFNYLKNKKRT